MLFSSSSIDQFMISERISRGIDPHSKVGLCKASSAGNKQGVNRETQSAELACPPHHTPLALTQITSPAAGMHRLRGTLISAHRGKLCAENISRVVAEVPANPSCHLFDCKSWKLSCRGDSAENCAAPGLCWITCLLLIINLVEIQIHCSDTNCYKIRPVPHLGLSGLFAFAA